jgi:uncharacterized membrane protein YsdA (DUF1294 family)
MNIFTFFLFIIDKFYALKNRQRVSESTLYFLSLGGGVFGAFIAMLATKHKLQKSTFYFIQVAILLAWIIGIYIVLSNLEQIQYALGKLSQ